jgi:hypothetical protein
MRQLKKRDSHLHYAVHFPSLLCILTGLAVASAASEPEVIGLDALRRERPALTGAGVWVAQVEASESPNAWQPSPSINPAASFRWTAGGGTSTTFPNAIGGQSSHATTVGTIFYGATGGVAPGVPEIDSYEAGYFINQVVVADAPISAQVINQSFITSSPLDSFYDGYAAKRNVLFVSGMNNIPDTPRAPGSAYNGIGVGIFSGTSAFSSVGPTSDGRAKPDLVAPNGCCSSATAPRVAGAAALLIQAAAANDGGPNTAALATNSSVIKALLLNGAVKTTNWTNGVTRPLDARFGAGVLNLYNSDSQLRGGRHTAVATNSVTLGAAHPPTAHPGNVASLRGWDLSVIQSSALNDRVAHYYFELSTNVAAWSATATLVWKKGLGSLTNLDLFLYDTQSNALIASSTSAVDNVEHLFLPRLAAGRYDLQVLKRGAQIGSESYALAFDFSPVALSVARNGATIVASWPASPAGFVLESATAFAPAASGWIPLGTPSVLSNGMNTVTVPAGSAARFFRLGRP